MINKVTLILRGYSEEQCLMILKEARKYDCFNLEITSNTPNWENIIRNLKKQELNSLKIGAGTILNMELLKKAINAGAEFVLSPITMTEEMLNYCKLNKVISIPGALSPSEIYQMIEEGADIVKVFPVSSVLNNYIKDVKSPLGNIDIMAVGGVNLKTIKEYFKMGANFVGIGSGLCSSKTLNKDSFELLSDNLKEINEQINGVLDLN